MLDDIKIKMKDFKISKELMLIYILSFVLILIGDQFSKMKVAQAMQVGQSQTYIDGLFYFTYAQNKGAAWGMLSGHIWLFVLVAIVAAIVIGYYFISSKNHQVLTRYGLVLVSTGLVGNLIDRLIYGYVRDFIDFVILGYDFPIFNIADICVVVGVALILIEIFFEEQLHGKHKNTIG